MLRCPLLCRVLADCLRRGLLSEATEAEGAAMAALHMASESRNKFGLDPKEPVGRLLDRMVDLGSP